jgi:uncharacterized protein with HEPN domain
MRPEILKYLEDIHLSIRAIEKYISDLSSLQEYENDDLITHSTIWQILKHNLPVLKQEVQSLLA